MEITKQFDTNRVLHVRNSYLGNLFLTILKEEHDRFYPNAEYNFDAWVYFTRAEDVVQEAVNSFYEKMMSYDQYVKDLVPSWKIGMDISNPVDGMTMSEPADGIRNIMNPKRERDDIVEIWLWNTIANRLVAAIEEAFHQEKLVASMQTTLLIK